MGKTMHDHVHQQHGPDSTEWCGGLGCCLLL